LCSLGSVLLAIKLHGNSQHDTVWTVDFETPVCTLYLLFISANAAQEKEKKEKKVLQPTGVSKSVAHTVLHRGI
jgi:hypothetical protein